MAYVRLQQKEHGAGELGGEIKKEDKIALVDDVATTGNSAIKASEILKELEEVAKKVASEGENPYAGESIPPQ